MANQPIPPTQPPEPPTFPTTTGPSTGLAVAAMICGIAGVLSCLPAGIAGIIMGIIALVRASREPARYGGKGMATAGIVTGGIGLIIIPFVVAILISILLPSFARARELSKRSVCAANMRGITQAILIYANDHDGAFPPNLDALVDGGDIGPKQLECPSAGNANYVYIPGLTPESPPDTPILYEPIDNHAGEGGNIAFVDGHVTFAKKDEYEKTLAPYLGSSP